MIRLTVIMYLWFLILSHVLGAPTNEFEELTKIADGDILPNEDKLLMNIVPGYTAASNIEPSKNNLLPDIAGLDKSNDYVKKFNAWIEKGVTKRGLTFTIYNDDMRKAAVALFSLYKSVKGRVHDDLEEWVQQNVNKEMHNYASRLHSLYGPYKYDILPPFISNPRYFVNSETVAKSFMILGDLNEKGKIDPYVAEVDQYECTIVRLDADSIAHRVTINSNYSGWNRPKNGIDEEINYFREDLGLNSYYLGLHLLHPFWMSNEELDQNCPRHGEHYYYVHQQLMARYLLEKEHLQRNKSNDGRDESDYVPYLSYENGLPFPTRSCVRGNWDNEMALIKSIDIAIKECIDRGLIFLENGTTINMTDDNHIEELARLIRANLDGIKTAKVVRSVFGYGGNRFPVDEYNPAPSLLHHPETSLRDPVYWFLIEYMLNYFNDYKKGMKPYDLTQYETEDLRIIDTDDTTQLSVTTCFHSYEFTLDYMRSYFGDDNKMSVRQRRLKHEPFEIKLAFKASAKGMAVVRLYLGPRCEVDCWERYSNFFELDTYLVELQEGYNIVLWSSKMSKKHSSDTAILKQSSKSKLYSLYKFPGNLLIPRGLESGLNLTLFVMVTPYDDEAQPVENNYSNAVKFVDSKPLGFPFHRPAEGFKKVGSNYRFYNITVFHKSQPESINGHFSNNLQ